jgi:predicted nucleic acid-binding protein
MSADHRAYLDTSALAKWYLNEAGSEAFVEFLQGLGAALISSLTVTEMRCLLSRRRRMGDLSVELESARTPNTPSERWMPSISPWPFRLGCLCWRRPMP